jgi:hypothetical protein
MNKSNMSRRHFLSSSALVAISTSTLSRNVFRQENSFISPLLDKTANNNDVLKLSVWFTSQDVDKYLSNEASLKDTINWCKQYGVTKVNFEAYGRGVYANRNTLLNAKVSFLKEGFEVAGGVLTADGPDNFAKFHCYTGVKKQEELQRMFEYTASIFDEIVIDDWYFTNCSCDDCITACGDQSWSKYRSDLMERISQERVMVPAHAVNPNVKVIIKYPQWNDQYQLRGYDVVRESKIFDGIWAGTEAREFNYETTSGYEIGYNSYFNMRWLATFGSVGGGWFDTGGDRTKVTTHLEQARHTVLGGGKQMILWHYGGYLQAAPKIEALSKELPGLIKLAKIVQEKPIKGVVLQKPGNSDPFDEEWICSFLGELGIPLMPANEITEKIQSAIFPVQVLKDPGFIVKLERLLATKTPVVITDGLAKRLAVYHPDLLKNENLTVLPVKGSPKTLLKMTPEELKPLREKLLAPFGIRFEAPSKVELYLFGDNTFVVENINDTAVNIALDFQHISDVSKTLTLPEDADVGISKIGNSVKIQIAANTLVVGKYK